MEPWGTWEAVEGIPGIKYSDGPEVGAVGKQRKDVSEQYLGGKKSSWIWWLTSSEGWIKKFTPQVCSWEPERTMGSLAKTEKMEEVDDLSVTGWRDHIQQAVGNPGLKVKWEGSGTGDSPRNDMDTGKSLTQYLCNYKETKNTGNTGNLLLVVLDQSSVFQPSFSNNASSHFSLTINLLHVT